MNGLSYVDLNALEWLLEHRDKPLGWYEFKELFAETPWKKADLKWFAAHEKRKFRIRPVMPDEFSLQHAEEIQSCLEDESSHYSKWINEEPTHVLVEKIYPDVREKIFLLQEDAMLYFRCTDEQIYTLLMAKIDEIRNFVDVDVINAANLYSAHAPWEAA